MRRLILMRHAKSAWDTDAPHDHARPLSGRGRRDAPRVGAYLAELGWVPDRVLSSDSARTRETWIRMAAAFDHAIDVIWSRRLYAAGLEEIEEAVADQDDAETLLVLGHNPGWEDAVTWLTGEEEPLTTANAALLEGDHATWLDGFDAPRRWRLVEVVRPKEIDG